MTVALRALAACAVLALLATGGAAAAPDAGRLTVPAGFVIERIATVPGARELAVAPNGDLFVGTLGDAVDIVAGAEGTPAPAKTFVQLADRPVASVVIDGGRMLLGAQFGVYELPYRRGDRTAAAPPRKIAAVRTSGVSRDHVTTTVAVAGGRLHASVGSSCNNCEPDLDATRATIQQLDAHGHLTPKARHIRNAIALAVNPQTGTLWAGVAGQDELAPGHPYEMFDPVTLHAGVVDYGFPYCYENHRAVGGHDCSGQTGARVSGSLSRRRVRDAARLVASAAGAAARRVRADERRRTEDPGRLERSHDAVDRIRRRFSAGRRTADRAAGGGYSRRPLVERISSLPVSVFACANALANALNDASHK